MGLQAVDLAICASWIIPVIPTNRCFEECAIVVNKGTITAIVPQAELHSRFQPTDVVALPGQVLIPGLINAHGHAAMALMRGFADDYPLMTWLEKHIWPAEGRFVSEEFVRDGTELAIAEMLSSGTTCFSDMYFFPEVAAEVAHECGIRAQLAFPVLDFPTVWGRGPDDYFDKGLKLHDRYRSHDRIRVAFGPHAPYTVSDPVLSRIVTYAEELQAPVQIHLHETAHEVSESEKNLGMRPSQRLAQLGLLSPLTQCVHVTQCNDDDLDLFSQYGVSIVHCPDSNLKLASGLAPISRMLAAGVNVALGTDGAASNNDLNLLAECQQAALLAKYQSGNAASVTAEQALAMATINGAIALGIEDQVGSLEVGKAADICAIDLNGLHHQPLHSPLSQVVYGNASRDVSNVWVKGRQLVKDRALTSLNTARIRQRAHYWREHMHHVD